MRTIHTSANEEPITDEQLDAMPDDTEVFVVEYSGRAPASFREGYDREVFATERGALQWGINMVHNNTRRCGSAWDFQADIVRTYAEDARHDVTDLSEDLVARVEWDSILDDVVIRRFVVAQAPESVARRQRRIRARQAMLGTALMVVSIFAAPAAVALATAIFSPLATAGAAMLGGFGYLLWIVQHCEEYDRLNLDLAHRIRPNDPTIE